MTPAFWQEQPPYLWTLITLDIPKLLGDRYPELQSLGTAYDLFTDTSGAAIVVDWKHRKCHRILKSCNTTALPKDFPVSGIVDPSEKYLMGPHDFYTWTGSGLECVARYLPELDSAIVLHPLAPSVFHYNNHVQTTYWYRDGSVYRRIDLSRLPFNRLDRIMLDRQRRMHFATDEGYAVMYPDGPEQVDLPQAAYPWSIQPDAQGSLWIGSYRDGLLQLSPGNGAVRRYPLPENEAEHQIFPGKLRGPGGNLLFGGYKGFYQLQDGKPVLFRLNESIEALCWDAVHRRYLVAGKQIYCIAPSLDKVLQTLPLPHKFSLGEGLSDLDIAADGSIWATGRGGILHLDAEGQEKTFYPAPGRSNCLLMDAVGTLWIGSQKGLFYLDPGSNQFLQTSDYLIRQPVNNLVQLPDHHLAVVTDSEVLLLDPTRPDKPLLKGYWSEKNGFQLLESFDNGACFDGVYLWIPASNGIQRIKLRDSIAKSPTRPRLRLDRMNHEAMAFDQTEPLNLVSGNAVDVDLSLINLVAGNYIPEYQLNGGDWKTEDKLTNLHITGLRHGQNTLRFRVRIPMMEESAWPSVEGRVQAHLPLMQRAFMKWILWAGGLLLVGFLGYGLYEQHKEKKLLALLHQTQLNTVQAQLNPHILFNLLSSLQNSIANRSKQEASDHLVRIAQLIREILELSISPDKDARYPFPTVTLQKEIRFLDNYLKLESIQHSPNFQYEILNEVSGPPERIAIPPLLVQPLAENAVIHGIKPNTGKTGLIRIRFREEADNMIITVEDNGAGPTTSSGARHPLFRYRSRGGELMQQRLHLIDKLGFPATWSVKPGPEGGTIAEIRIKKML